MYRRTASTTSAIPPRQLQWFIADAKEDGPAARTRSRPATSSRAGWSSTTRCTRRCASAKASSISPSCCCAATSSWRDNDGAARALPAPLLAPAGRRVPGHQRRCSTSGCACSPGPHTAVFAVGDDDQSIYAFRGANVANMQHFERDFATPERAGAADQARAELPLARPHPRRRQRADQAQPGASRQEPVDERRQGRAGARVRGAVATSTRRRSSSTSSKGLADDGVRARPKSRCCTARTRSRACSSTRCSMRRHPLPRLRRHALLRARRGQARARVPAPHRRARRRRRVPARRQFSAARHRRAHAGARCRTPRARRARRLWQAACAGGDRRQGGDEPRARSSS